MRIALPPVIAPDALAGPDRQATIVDLAGRTMGTTWRVKFAAGGPADPGEIQDLIVAKLAALVAEMSHWESGSLLSRFNRAASGTWFTLPPDFANVIAAGLRIAAQSDGAFDPAIGAVVDLWGFGPTAMSAPPGAHTLAATLARSGWRRLIHDPAARRLRQPGGLALDLSGIAKGYAVDAVADLLRVRGVHHCLVEIGGELAGRGVRPDGDPWWVELEDPPGIALPPLRIALHGLAVATSGDYRRGGHTIDARTGCPAANGVVSVSVIHTSTMAADAWATALTVLGAREAIATATRRDIAARLITDVSGRREERLTPALAAMLAD